MGLYPSFMADTDVDTINCPIGKWYFKRMTLLGLLLIGFGGWFLYDGLVGYPKKQVKAVAFEAFAKGAIPWEEYAANPDTNYAKASLSEEEIEMVRDAHTAGGQKATWADYALENDLDPGEPPSDDLRPQYGAFKKGAAMEWDEFAKAEELPVDPQSIEDPARRNSVELINKAFNYAKNNRRWKEYAAGKGLPDTEPHFYGKSDILEQYIFGGACAVGGIIALIVMLMNRNRSVKADGDAYYPKTSLRIPFSDVHKIDTRKWRRKGLAYAYYKSSAGEEKKAVIDDLKFEGSQAILDRLKDNFEGELIEEFLDEEGTPEMEGQERSVDDGSEPETETENGDVKGA